MNECVFIYSTYHFFVSWRFTILLSEPIARKIVRLVIRKSSPKAVIAKMTQRQPLLISEHEESENPDLEPEGNSEILLKGKGLCYYCNGENICERAVVKCPRSFWYDGYRICPICAHQIPVDRKHLTDGFIWCADCHVVKHINSKTLKRPHYPPSEDEDD